MMPEQIVTAFTLFMGTGFVFYVVLILVPFLRQRPLKTADPSQLNWQFFVPCRDEEAVIMDTIGSLRRNFPMAHVWVIDDDSEDETAAIVRAASSSDSHIHGVYRARPEARLGKGAALNSAYAALNRWLPADADRFRTVVVVVDADGELAANALSVCAGDDVFGNPRVGAAQVAVWMRNRFDPHPLQARGTFANWRARWLLRMQDMEFRTVIAAMQALRAKVGTVGLGGNGQFTRLTTLDSIAKEYGHPWHGALLEDYELGLHVLMSGGEIRSVYDTHVSQEALPSVRRLIAQRTRWAQGNIQCVRYLGRIVRSEHFSSAGVIEAGYYLLLPALQVLGAAAYIGLGGVAVARLITTGPELHGTLAVLHVALFGLLNLIFAILPFAVWGPVYRLRCQPELSKWQGVLYGLVAWIYVYYMYICIFNAFWRLLRRQNGWVKTRRNAEDHSRGPTAIAA